MVWSGFLKNIALLQIEKCFFFLKINHFLPKKPFAACSYSGISIFAMLFAPQKKEKKYALKVKAIVQQEKGKSSLKS